MWDKTLIPGLQWKHLKILGKYIILFIDGFCQAFLLDNLLVFNHDFILTRRNLQKIIKDRDIELAKEAVRQEENDKFRKDFAKYAKAKFSLNNLNY